MLPLLLRGPSQPSQTPDAQDPQRLDLEILHTVYKSEAREIAKACQVTQQGGREEVSPTDWSLPPATERGPVLQGEWAGETLPHSSCEVAWGDEGVVGV